ncbi:L,D-transpeptidase family protein [Maricaulis sp.]|uniref:L,D-transpeptidase family protein n=1 Tax=Maricaulis sp. TaxID=1486257 RepID=UPI002612172C|nr:L,D-transpeptidase family protein [Maricaulis sp.]
MLTAMSLLICPPETPFAPHDARLSHSGKRYRCAVGRTGLIAEGEKCEGDGATPIGRYRLLSGFYRADRIARPLTAGLVMTPIQPGMGWQDDPASSRYNCLIPDGYPMEGEESFLRQDDRYDIIVVLDHNAAWPHPEARPPDVAVKPGGGSAIFLHVWNETDGKPTGTAGCVAMRQADLLAVLAQCATGAEIVIREA